MFSFPQTVSNSSFYTSSCSFLTNSQQGYASDTALANQLGSPLYLNMSMGAELAIDAVKV